MHISDREILKINAMHRHPLYARSGRRGFTLVEILLALAIAVYAFAFIFRASLLSLSALDESQVRLDLLNNFRNKIVEIKLKAESGELALVEGVRDSAKVGENTFYYNLGIGKPFKDINLYRVDMTLHGSKGSRKISMFHQFFYPKR